MTNPLLDRLPQYPFDRLRALLDGTDPPDGIAPLALSIGEPQHPTPPMIAEALTANAHLWNRYPPVDGTPEFRQAVADWLARRYALPDGALDADAQVLPVAGTREALYLVASLAVPAGETHTGNRRPIVVMPNPHYHIYAGSAIMAGADIVYAPATRESGFLPDLGALDEPTLDRAALVYLCSPANPQGAIADLDYLRTAVRLARAHDFVLVMDECYAEIYDRAPPPGALQVCLGDEDPLGIDNVIVFHSLSKRSSAAGLRSGFVAGDPDLIAKFKGLRSYSAAGVPLPSLAASARLWRDEAHVEENRAQYRAKFDLAEKILGGRFGFYRPAGGFFLWLDVGDGEAATRRLWAEAGLRVLPGAYLSHDGSSPDGGNPGSPYIRVALVHDLATLEDALQRLDRVLR
jgi:succinyldiaminopimelate transaminase